ncbi:MAG: hypothetical protein IT353_04825 [Gemmatimonadaceae bacterium]|nr:hypothetical protein [Gemmatimonadaceae bacterium]
MSSLNHITRLLADTEEGPRRFPPTLLYNEGWLLRLVVDWYHRHPEAKGTLTFHAGAEWYSEALLESPFLRGQYREGFTHADAVIGHFEVRKERGDIALRPEATQFLVVEAKMGSPLSAGTKHAADYNQAARNVACMIKLIERYVTSGASLSDARFIVIAPESKLKEHGTRALLDRVHLCEAIRRRAEGRSADDVEWVNREVVPRLTENVLIPACISWEELLTEIAGLNSDDGKELSDFYGLCREHNRIREAENRSSQ